MKTLAIDKSSWGPGPWQNEPDRIEWESSGFPCLMTRTPMGNWCGYVAVSDGHPYYGIDYSRCTRKPACKKSVKDRYCNHSPGSKLNVHGGLTYSDRCQGHICHVPKPGQSDNVWWFGFDCAHSWDLVPSMKPLMIKLGHPNPGFLDDRTIYRDVPYVKRAVEGLAEQLRGYQPIKDKKDRPKIENTQVV